jgi:hypothetical protein
LGAAERRGRGKGKGRGTDGGQILRGEDEEEVEGTDNGRVGANCGGLLHNDALNTLL